MLILSPFLTCYSLYSSWSAEGYFFTIRLQCGGPLTGLANAMAVFICQVKWMCILSWYLALQFTLQQQGFIFLNYYSFYVPYYGSTHKDGHTTLSLSLSWRDIVFSVFFLDLLILQLPSPQPFWMGILWVGGDCDKAVTAELGFFPNVGQYCQFREGLLLGTVHLSLYLSPPHSSQYLPETLCSFLSKGEKSNIFLRKQCLKSPPFLKHTQRGEHKCGNPLVANTGKCVGS